MKNFQKLALVASLLVGAVSFGQISVSLNGTTLYVYNGSNQQIVTWNDYKTHQIFGNYIALLDTNNVFGVFSEDGRTVVNNYTHTQQWWLGSDFVGILDSTGVFDAYRLSDSNRFINNWTKVVKVDVGRNHIALLDSDGVFDAYNGDGSVIVKNYKDAVQFQVARDYVAVLDRNGIFDAYHRNGSDLIRNWNKTVKYLAHRSLIALLDSDGVMQAYRVSDGFQVIKETGVQDIQLFGELIQYQINGQWYSFQQ